MVSWSDISSVSKTQILVVMVQTVGLIEGNGCQYLRVRLDSWEVFIENDHSVTLCL